MAMLAAPRRKQKVINLRAKNNAWSNDSTKFGQRMLEKMGWSEGKGLGAHENGIVEHVVAKYKNDDNGLGYEDRNDQWTKHEDDFNSLLANLSNGDVNEDKLHSGVSLEVKSKKSKARVHYHKFTRGKDLTRYSEKDLANIFGKKSLKPADQQQQVIQEVDDVKTTEQVFTDKGSMVDYFKNKLAAFKSKAISMNNNSNYDDDRTDFVFKGFSGTDNDEGDKIYQDSNYQGFSLTTNENTVEKENTDDSVYIENKKKKSKKKKKDRNSELQSEIADGNVQILGEEVSEEIEVKKTKKKKSKCDSNVPVEEITVIKKSKKKSKVMDSIEDISAECNVPKKKKKRKNKDFE